MKVKIHKLFEYLLKTTDRPVDAVVGFSLASSPTLGAFMDDLDPAMSLDWNQRSFQGLPELREHVIRQAGLTGTCGADDVLITAGAAEANYIALLQLLQPGDEIVLEQPGWPQAQVLAQSMGIKINAVRRRPEQGWALPLDELEAAVNERTRLIFLTNPNNPTGKLLTEAELSRLAQIADRAGAYLLVDEVYAGLEWMGDRRPSIAGLYERGITTGSVSKALGLQGLRTGWMICRDRTFLLDAVIRRENMSEIMNVMGEVIAEIALRPERYDKAITAAREEGMANLRKLDAFVENQPLLSWHRPEGGLIGLARLHSGQSSDDFADGLLSDPYRTFLLPGSAYGEDDHIRLGVGGGASANLDLGLSRLADYLRGLPSAARLGR